MISSWPLRMLNLRNSMKQGLKWFLNMARANHIGVEAAQLTKWTEGRFKLVWSKSSPAARILLLFQSHSNKNSSSSCWERNMWILCFAFSSCFLMRQVFQSGPTCTGSMGGGCGRGFSVPIGGKLLVLTGSLGDFWDDGLKCKSQT